VRGSPEPDIRNADEFVAFERPGYMKAAMNFSIEFRDDHTELRTETRVLPIDPSHAGDSDATGGSSIPEARRYGAAGCGQRSAGRRAAKNPTVEPTSPTRGLTEQTGKQKSSARALDSPECPLHRLFR
jgi:hypothetical protein